MNRDYDEGYADGYAQARQDAVLLLKACEGRTRGPIAQELAAKVAKLVSPMPIGAGGMSTCEG